MIKITEVKVTKMKDKGTLKGFANIVIDGCFAIRGLKVIDGSKGTFIAFPSTKNNKDEFKDIAFPITKECREVIEKEVLAAYEVAEDPK